MAAKIYVHFLLTLDVNKTGSKLTPNLLDTYLNIFLRFMHDHLSFEADIMANFSKNIYNLHG